VTLVLGELGLGGEVRAVPQLEMRLREAARLGVEHAIVPHVGNHAPKIKGIALQEVRRLSQAMQAL
jgi:DNA repair protein RadA/Sms